MFDFLRKLGLGRPLNSSPVQKRSEKERRRALFLEPLEERRLLAADLAISAISIDGGAFTAVSEPIANIPLTEGQTIAVQIRVSDGATPIDGDDVANFQVEANTVPSGNPLSGDFSGATTITQPVPAGTFTNGTTFNLAPFTITDDLIVEGPETFSITLSTAAGAVDTAVGAPSTFNIDVADNDSATISIGSPTVAEAPGAQASLTISLDVSIDSPINIGFVTADGAGAKDAREAALGYDGTNDYQAVTGSTTLQTGGDDHTFTVDINNDATMELFETFSVNLSDLTGLIAAGYDISLDTPGVVTITDTDTFDWVETAAPSTQAEGDFDITTSGTTGSYEVYGNQAANRIQATVAAVDGTAQEAVAAIGSDDYDISSFSGDLLSNATINRSAGGSGRIGVVKEDAVVELDETLDVQFTVTNDQGFGALITNTPATQTLTITNDDSATISISTAASLTETNAATTHAFTINSSADVQTSGAGFIIRASLAEGTATDATAISFIGDGDYDDASFENTAWDGDSSAAIISGAVAINGDTIVELDETFDIQINPDGAGATDSDLAGLNVALGGAETVTIINDDSATISIATAASLTETNAATTHAFTVSSDVDIQTNGTTFTIRVGQADGTATSGSAFIGDGDYTNATFTYAGWNGDSGAGTIGGDSVTINGDTIVELDETFNILVNPDGAGATDSDLAGLNVTLAGAQTVTITNDDSATISISTTASLTETNAAATHAFTVSSDADVQTNGTTFTIRVGQADGTATSGSAFIGDGDYTNATFTYAGWNGDSGAGTIGGDSVTINGDTIVELDETFNILVNPDGAGATDSDLAGLNVTLAAPQTVTITNDDSATITIAVDPADADADGDGDPNTRTEGDAAGSIALPFDIVSSNEVQTIGTSFNISISYIDGALPAGATGVFGAGPVFIGDSDYINTAFTLSPNWNGSGTVVGSGSVDINGDTIVELDETFEIDIDNDGVGATNLASLNITLGGTGTVTITNDDSTTITIAVDPADADADGDGDPNTRTEGDAAGSIALPFDIISSNEVQTNGSSFDIGISYIDGALPAGATGVFGAGSAFIGDGDYINAAFTLTPHWDGSGTLIGSGSVDVNGDTIVELDETFEIDFDNDGVGGTNLASLNITLGGTETVTITNDDSATVSIATAASLTETNAATTHAFTVSSDADIQTNGTTFTVRVGQTDGTATSGSAFIGDGDYTNATFTYTGWNGDSGAGTIGGDSVAINGDAIVELDETFNILVNPDGAGATDSDLAGLNVTLAAPQTVTITNDDSATISISTAASLTETNAATTHAFTVSSDADIQTSGTGFTIRASLAEGTATDSTAITFIGDGDYDDASFENTAWDGDSSAAIISGAVAINGDTIVELDETFDIQINPDGAGATDSVLAGLNVALGSAETVTITNDDSATISITTAASLTETNAATTHAFTINSSADVQTSGAGFIIRASLAEGTATDSTAITFIGDGDYDDASFENTAWDGDSSAAIISGAVAINGDTIVELDENFDIQINPDGAGATDSDLAGLNVALGSAETVTITNDDSATISITTAASLTETNAATTHVFTINSSADVQTSGAGFIIRASLAEGTATDATAITFIGDGDYDDASFENTAWDGDSSAAIISGAVAINGDTIVELDETFDIQINPDGAGATDSDLAGLNVALGGAETVTIINDDSATISISTAASLTETNAATTHAFTVSSDADIQTNGTTFTIRVGQADGTATSGSAFIGDGDYTNAIFTYAGWNGDSGAGTIGGDSVTINGDAIVELDETFDILVNPDGAGATDSDLAGLNVTLAAPQTVTIINDDSATISISTAASLTETNVATTHAFTINSSADVQTSGTGFTIRASLAEGTATDSTAITFIGDGDYDDASFENTAWDGDSSAAIISGVVAINGDTIVELDETFNIQVNPDGAGGTDSDLAGLNVTLAAPQTVTITNDDSATISIAVDAGDTDGDGNTNTLAETNGATSIPFTITSTADVQTNGTGFSIRASLAEGTATDSTAITFIGDGDYDDASFENTAWDGDSSAAIISGAVAINGDTIVELDETFDIQINPDGAGATDSVLAGLNVALGSAETVTITNDDSATISITTAASLTETNAATTHAFTINSSADVQTSGTTFTIRASLAEGTATDSTAITFIGDGDYDDASFENTAWDGDSSSAIISGAVAINGDTIVELDETFDIQINPDGAGATDSDLAGLNVALGGAETVTIINDDSATISITTAASLTETNAATTHAFTINSTADVQTNGTTFTIRASLAEGTATDSTAITFIGDGDYDDASFENTAWDGDSSAAIISGAVAINGDTIVELDEAFDIQINPAGAGATDSDLAGLNVALGSAETVTIINDDSATLSINTAASLTETNAVTTHAFTVTSDADVQTNSTGFAVRVSQIDGALPGGATSGSAFVGDGDYVNTLIERTDWDGDSSATVIDTTITINGDTIVEQDETFQIHLNADNGGGTPESELAGLAVTLGADAGVTINNDDSTVISFVPSSISVAEGDTPASNVQAFTIVSSSSVQTQGETFVIEAETEDIAGENATAAGATVGDGDYTDETYTESAWNGDSATAIVDDDVNIITDEIVERDESFQVVFTAGTNLGPFTADITLAPSLDLTILNDDSGSFAITATSATGLEDSGIFSVDLTLDAQVQTYGIGPLTITGNSANGARTADGDTNAYTGTNDYDDTAATLSYDGTTLNDTQTFTISVSADNIVEIDEQFIVDFVENNLLGYGANVHPVTSALGTNDLTVTTAQTTMTIQNDDIATVTHSNLSGSVPEGTAATFEVALSNPVQTATFNTGTIDNTRTLETDYATGDAIIGDLVAPQQLATANDGTTSFQGDEDYTPVSATWSYVGGDALAFNFNVDSTDDAVVEHQEVYRTNYAENDYLGYGAAGLDRVQLDLSTTLGLINQEDSAEFNLVAIPNAFAEGTSESGEDLNTTGPYDIVLDGDVQDYDGDGFTINYQTADGTAVAGTLPPGENGDRDYVAVDLNHTFDGWDGSIAPPVGESFSFTVDVRMDEVVEADETFDLNLAEIDFDGFGQAGTGQLLINDGNETLTIQNDDSAHLEVLDISVSEAAGTVTVQVALDYAVDVPLTVRATASDGLALHRTATSDPANGDEEYQWPGGVWQDFVTLTFDGAGVDSGTEGTADPENNSFAEIQTVTFDILDDTVVEQDEEFYLNIFNLQQLADGATNPRDVQIGDDDGAVTVVDDDEALITIGTTTLAEDGTPATVTVSTSGLVDIAYTFDVVTADGSAGASAGDYTPTTTGYSVAAFSDGALADFSVAITDDNVVEVTENLLATINNLVDQGRSIRLAGPGVITITDADQASLTINDVTFIEGDGDKTLVQLTVTLDTEVDVPVTVDYLTAVGTATSATTGVSGDQDYLDSSGQLTFVGQAGEQQKISVYVNGDNVVEATEALSVGLSTVAASGRDVIISDDTGVLTITNDDSAVLSIEPASSTTEGSDGQLVVTLSNPVDENVTYTFTSVDTGDATADVDYTTTTDADVAATVVTFSNLDGADLSKAISVPTTADNVVELDEDFDLAISAPATDASVQASVTAGNQTGTITIANDDAATITIDSVTVNEDAGTATLTATLAEDVDTIVTVNASTVDGTAVDSDQGGNGVDYTAKTETLTFPANGAANSQTFVVDINDDNIVELNEVFSAVLDSLSAGGRDVSFDIDSGTVTILNNDTAQLDISLVTNPVTLTEDSGTVTFNISLSNPTAVPTTVNYAGVNPALPSSYDDFVGGAGSVTFDTFNNTTQQVTLDVFDDAVVELDEDFSVQLFGLDVGAIQDFDNSLVTVGSPTESFTVIDNDSATITINDISVTEDDHGHDNAILTVTLSGAVDVPVDVQFDSQDVTAISVDNSLSGDSDFESVSAGNVRLDGSDGATEQISIRINGDGVVELDETLNVLLSNIAAAGREDAITFAKDTGVVTIENDDSATVSIEQSTSVTEGDSGQANANLVVTLSAPVDVGVGFSFDSQDGTATLADGDYQVASGTPTFSNVAGASLSQTVSVAVNGDGTVELDEALSIELSSLNVAGGRQVTFGNTNGTVNVVNDDSATVTIDDVVINEEAGTATLNVTLSDQVDAPVTVPFQTLDGTALLAFGDYTSLSGNLVFAPGEILRSVGVTVTDDDIVELDEFLSLGLEEAQASGRDVTVFDDSLEQTTNTAIKATGRIDVLNNDTADITITADQDFFIEGDDGITSATLTVSLSNPVDIPILLVYSTVNGDYNSTTNAGLPNDDPLAVAAEYAGINSTADNADPSDPPGEYDFVNSAMADDHDYDDSEAVLNFAAVNDGLQHTDPLTQQITIPVYGDNVVELDEWLSVTISGWEFLGRDGGNNEITVSQKSDFVWIDNDDSASFTIADVTLTEGDAGSVLASIAVILDNGVDVSLSVDYQTQDGTDEVGGDNGAVEADGGVSGDNDYQQTSGTLVFAGIAGEQHEILVPVNGDTIVELDEYFNVLLTDLEAAHRDVTIEDSTGRVDIDNDDSATVMMGDAVVTEGDSGITPASINIFISSPVDVDVTMDFAPGGGDADTNDYQSATGTGTVTFTAGSQAQVVVVDINGDTEFERHEELLLDFSNLSASNRDVTFEDADSKVTIINDDRNPLGLDTQNILHSEPGAVDPITNVASFDFSVAENEQALDLLFVATAAPGGTLQVGPSVVVDSEGTPIAPLKIGNYDSNDPAKSFSVFRLSAGDFHVIVPAANGTSGLVELLVAMPGIMGTESVEDRAMQLATGGTLQTQLGIRGVSSTIFSDELGIDLSQPIFEQELDADLNGIITAFDLMTVNTNHRQQAPGVYLIESAITPASYFQVDPTGQDSLNIAELFGFSIYQNPSQPLDVNMDGNITPVDALTVINSLNTDGARSVLVIDSNPHPLMVHDRYLYDTNGDFAISALDALYVINQLNVGDAGGPESEGEAEGEALTVISSPLRVVSRSTAAVGTANGNRDAALTDFAMGELVGDKYRTSATTSDSTSWRDRVESVFGEDDLYEELNGEEDFFGHLK